MPIPVSIAKDLIEVFKNSTGVIGVGFGWWLNRKHSLGQKDIDFAERQITGFYAPMVGWRKQILVLNELRAELDAACDAGWQDVLQHAAQPFHGVNEAFEPYRKQIEVKNRRFKEETLPLYNLMANHFMENLWLASTTTQPYFIGFSKFVRTWHYHLDDPLPSEALLHLNHDEAGLLAFYEELDRELVRLTELVARRKKKRLWWRQDATSMERTGK